MSPEDKKYLEKIKVSYAQGPVLDTEISFLLRVIEAQGTTLDYVRSVLTNASNSNYAPINNLVFMDGRVLPGDAMVAVEPLLEALDSLSGKSVGRPSDDP